MTSLPPPLPGGRQVPPAPPAARVRRRGPGLLRAGVALVAWTAGFAGALVGSQVADWLDSPPKSASDEPINVSEPRGPIERRLDVAEVIDHMAASVITLSADVG